jgi:hypothetical protein
MVDHADSGKGAGCCARVPSTAAVVFGFFAIFMSAANVSTRISTFASIAVQCDNGAKASLGPAVCAETAGNYGAVAEDCAHEIVTLGHELVRMESSALPVDGRLEIPWRVKRTGARALERLAEAVEARGATPLGDWSRGRDLVDESRAQADKFDVLTRICFGVACIAWVAHVALHIASGPGAESDAEDPRGGSTNGRSAVSRLRASFRRTTRTTIVHVDPSGGGGLCLRVGTVASFLLSAALSAGAFLTAGNMPVAERGGLAFVEEHYSDAAEGPCRLAHATFSASSIAFVATVAALLAALAAASSGRPFRADRAWGAARGAGASGAKRRRSTAYGESTIELDINAPPLSPSQYRRSGTNFREEDWQNPYPKRSAPPTVASTNDEEGGTQ